MLSFDERKKLLSDAVERGDVPIEINCTGAPLDKIRNARKTILAEIYNRKTRRWQKVELTEYLDICPVCGKLMKVTAVVGSTWVAACCEEHTIRTLKELEKGWYGIKKDKEKTDKDKEKTDKDKEKTDKDKEKTDKDKEKTDKDKEKTDKDKEKTDKDKEKTDKDKGKDT